MHTVMVCCDRVIFHIDDIGMVWHGAHPCAFLGIIPRIPEHLIVAERCAGCHREAYPVGFDILLNSGKSPLHIVCRGGVLRLEVLMKDTDFFVRVKFFLEIQSQV